LPQVLNAAARLFGARGFDGTSVRDIARAVGMLPGSLYCHFATKEDLLAAVYLKGVEQISGAVLDAIATQAQPWNRLEAACEAHLQAILRDDDYAQVLVRVRPTDAPAVCNRLIELRNQYEALFASVVNDLPLAAGTDRQVLRLMLMGALNWSQLWYRPDGRASPKVIAHQFVSLLRRAQEASPCHTP
jgi:AcrR family transcriptional regulator